MVKPPNLPDRTGVEELEQETKVVAVQIPEYWDTMNSSLSPQTNRKMSHTSKEIKFPSEKASLAWKRGWMITDMVLAIDHTGPSAGPDSQT